MRNFKLNRRTVLRGAGSIAIALPWLEVMGEAKDAKAQAVVPANRFLSVFTPGGTVLDAFWPTVATDPSSSPILTPLQPVASKLAVLEGLDYKCKAGEQHQAGIIAFLTGSKQTGSPNNYSSYPSIDQVIATKISRGIKKMASLQMAVRWATGRSKGLLHPINAANFEDNAAKSPIPPLLDPVAIFNELFGMLDPNAAPGIDARIARRKSVLDFVHKRYDALSLKLGATDKARLEEHLSKIRDLELGLDKGVVGDAKCHQPTLIDTSKYDYAAGLNMTAAVDTVQPGAIETDKLIPDVGKLMMDMMVMALACDITAVGSFQWSDTEAKHTFPWLNLAQHHHFYQHDGGFQKADCQSIGHWYSEQHLYLLQAMDKIDMGGHTLLDESVVFFGSEVAHPPDHSNTNIPLMLAGAGGGLKGGRHLKYGGRPHNDLLVGILNLFGDTRTTYGHTEFNTSPINNLTG
ncbi:MAG TPA: DUF1552 domain-containing protein [Polyangiaceae bacterium]|nr:DUF1552 domain-containing protein [Polyangiaceae bacterium]